MPVITGRGTVPVRETHTLILIDPPPPIFDPLEIRIEIVFGNE
jgi:hypothetical protein